MRGFACGPAQHIQSCCSFLVWLVTLGFALIFLLAAVVITTYISSLLHILRAQNSIPPELTAVIYVLLKELRDYKAVAQLTRTFSPNTLHCSYLLQTLLTMDLPTYSETRFSPAKHIQEHPVFSVCREPAYRSVASFKGCLERGILP